MKHISRRSLMLEMKEYVRRVDEHEESFAWDVWALRGRDLVYNAHGRIWDDGETIDLLAAQLQKANEILLRWQNARCSTSQPELNKLFDDTDECRLENAKLIPVDKHWAR